MNCKKLFYSFCVLLSSLSLTAQERPLPVAELVQNALSKAGAEDKKVFVIAHASWCVWCRKMDRSMTDDAGIKALFDKAFIVTHITAYESKGKEALENPGAVAFLTSHGGADEGLPFWLIFDSKGVVLADSKMKYEGKQVAANSGCPANKEEVAHFIAVLRKTTSFTETELAKISTRFRMNESN